MKKLILMMALSIVLCIVFVDRSSAQIKLPEVTITSPDQLPAKVAEAFKSTFKDAEAPRWYHPNANYVVTFLQNDIKQHALFSKRGTLIYHVSYGTENILPQELKPMIEERFKGYQIIAAIQVRQSKRDIWFVTGEGKSDFLNVSIEDGIMSEPTRVKRYAMVDNAVLSKDRN